jgi:hypothetical protein
MFFRYTRQKKIISARNNETHTPRTHSHSSHCVVFRSLHNAEQVKQFYLASLLAHAERRRDERVFARALGAILKILLYPGVWSGYKK